MPVDFTELFTLFLMNEAIRGSIFDFLYFGQIMIWTISIIQLITCRYCEGSVRYKSNPGYIWTLYCTYCTADHSDGVGLTRQREVDHTGQESIFPRRSGPRTVLGIGDLFDVWTFRLQHRNRTSWSQKDATHFTFGPSINESLCYSRVGLFSLIGCFRASVEVKLAGESGVPGDLDSIHLATPCPPR